MPQTIPIPATSTPYKPLDGVRPRMAKASQLPSRAVNDPQFGMTAIVRDGLIRACGSLKAAAITMAMDQGQLTRDLQSGAFKFERLEKLSGDEKAIVVACLHDAYSPLAVTPAEHAEQLIDKIQSDLNEVRQFVRSA